MIKYINSSFFDKETLLDVLKIDSLVYPKEYQGTYKSVSKRFSACKKMFIYAYNEDDELIGYICFFPIKDSLLNKIVNSNNIFDDNIKKEEITNYQKGMTHNIFVISIAITKKYQKKGIGKILVEKMIAFLINVNKDNIKINNIYATTINKSSQKLFQHFNFKVLKTYSENETLLKLNLKDYC